MAVKVRTRAAASVVAQQAGRETLRQGIGDLAVVIHKDILQLPPPAVGDTPGRGRWEGRDHSFPAFLA